MKRQILAAALSLVTVSAFALPVTEQAISSQAKPTAALVVTHGFSVAQDGSDRSLNTVAQDGSDRSLNTVAQDGSDRSLNTVAQDGSDRSLNTVAQDGADRSLNATA